jgi:hypothetical protein
MIMEKILKNFQKLELKIFRLMTRNKYERV